VNDSPPSAPFLTVPGVLGGTEHFLVLFVGALFLPAVPQAVTKRYYIVDNRPRVKEEHLVLGDGSAVICSASDEASARIVSSSDKRLEVRRHSDLSEADQRQLQTAI